MSEKPKNELRDIFGKPELERTISVELKKTAAKQVFLYQIGLYSVGPKQKRKRRAREYECLDAEKRRAHRC